MEENWDEEVFVIEQIKEDASNFNKASDRLKNDKEFIMEVLNLMPEVIDYVSDELKNDQEFYRKLATKLDIEVFNNKKYKDIKEKAEKEIIDEFVDVINFEGEKKVLETPKNKEDELKMFHDLYWTFVDKGLEENRDFFFSQAAYGKDKRYGSSFIFKKDDKLLGLVNMEDRQDRYLLLTDNPEDFEYAVNDVDELKKFMTKGKDISETIDKLNGKAVSKEKKETEEKQPEDMTMDELEEMFKETLYSTEEKREELEALQKRELIKSIKELQKEGQRLDAKIKELKEKSMESR